MTDHDLFAVLGLPRAFDLDPAALDARARERARELHPDRFARATPDERRRALDAATRVNDARRTLRAWPARAAHLLALAGVDADAARPAPTFLEAQLAVRERIEAARARGDAAALAALGREARGALAALEADLAAAFRGEGWDAPGPAARIAARLAEVRFLENAAAAAGEDG